jgi:hypothetical protein
MSLLKLIIGIILLVLIYHGVKEWKKLRKRSEAEEELAKIRAEEAAIGISEEAELRREELEKRKKELLDLKRQ